MDNCIFVDSHFKQIFHLEDFIFPFFDEIHNNKKILLLNFLNSSFVQNYPLKVIIQLEKFISLINNTKELAKKDVKELFLQSRFSFMGTDGMRGKIIVEKTDNPLTDFIDEQLLSPELIYISSKAFIKMLSDNGTITKQSNLCSGNDGRDSATNWALTNAMNHGLEANGHKVFDLGIVPTPVVPYQMIADSMEAGAMLTASHNPSDQNGIKFFINGKKLLPEGKNGDYELSAYMFLERSSLNTSVEIRSPSHATKKEVDFIGFMEKELPQDMSQTLNSVDLFFDNANGAWADLAAFYFAKHKIAYKSSNEKPLGTNINQHCGVAEIEGQSFYTKADYASAPAIVQSMFDTADPQKPSFAIVVDGDGDRGFLLYLQKSTEKIFVLGGEHLSIILAALVKKNRKHFLKNTCVYTIESDVLIANSFQNLFGIKSEIVDVGDKWICNYPKNNMLFGFESSGHFILPVFVKTESGTIEYRAGNGFYTCLLALYALGQKGFSETFLEDYKASFSKTLYTYFIDKTLFYKNASAWNEVKKLLETELDAWLKTQKSSFSVHEQNLNDPNVLYYAIKDGKNAVGAVFIRNSGTENKNAVYLKCDDSFSKDLLIIAEKIAKTLRSSIINKDNSEYKISQSIISIVDEEGLFEPGKSYESLKDLGETQLNTVLHALIKQGILKRDINTYKRSTNG